MTRGRRDRKPNLRLLGDDWDNDEDGEEHMATVDSGDKRNKCSSLGSKGCPVINRRQRHRKRNARIFGDEWDNEDSGEQVPPVDVGDGDVPLDDHGRLEVPSSIAFTPEEEDPESMEKKFFEHVYAGLQAKRGQDRDDFLKGTAVLVPKNDTATRINDSLLDALIDGEEDRLFVSINGITDGWHQRDDAYPEEYLASIKESGLPPHVIRLKIGAPIIALRNITKGVSNGTRMVVTKILNHSIKARVVHGPSTGREVLITRVVMTQSLGSFVLQRTQLPIRVAFAMTINKAQGLTLQRVGVYLQDDVFSHGQLYVALSRCGDDQNLWVFGPQPDDQGKLWMKNVVYKEILIDTYHHEITHSVK